MRFIIPFLILLQLVLSQSTPNPTPTTPVPTPFPSDADPVSYYAVEFPDPKDKAAIEAKLNTLPGIIKVVASPTFEGRGKIIDFWSVKIQTAHVGEIETYLNSTGLEWERRWLHPKTSSAA